MSFLSQVLDDTSVWMKGKEEKKEIPLFLSTSKRQVDIIDRLSISGSFKLHLAGLSVYHFVWMKNSLEWDMVAIQPRVLILVLF